MAKENKIRNLAYQFYEKRKGKDNLELDDWLKAEKMVLRKEKISNVFFKFLRHPLFLLCISGVVIWGLQQSYLEREKLLAEKYEIFTKVSPIHSVYYQEIWNQWYAFRDKTPSEEYRRNIQRIVVEAKSIEIRLPILFKDKKIYEDWKEFLRIFWEANYPISREGISEQQLNEKLNSAALLLNDILNRMFKEVR
ncbi:MAG: DUF2934 domain-containing protein [Candidatus Omnitrophota bacterium]